MLRSFTTLARTLNLSKTVEELGVTRQTIRRHINDLEELKGARLFEMIDRQYVLTPEGTNALGEAEKLVASAESWISGDSATVDGLNQVRFRNNTGYSFFSQEHPTHEIWTSGVPILKAGFNMWVRSEGRLEHPSMKKIRPYLVVYRKYGNDWLCAEVGEKSSYATWLGWTWARSAVGSLMRDDPTDVEDDRFVMQAYNNAFTTGHPRYDHISAHYARHEGGPLEPVNYQRLLLVCFFPDGSPALAALVARTNQVSIDFLDSKYFMEIPKEELMEFEI